MQLTVQFATRIARSVQGPQLEEHHGRESKVLHASAKVKQAKGLMGLITGLHLPFGDRPPLGLQSFIFSSLFYLFQLLFLINSFNLNIFIKSIKNNKKSEKRAKYNKYFILIIFINKLYIIEVSINQGLILILLIKKSKKKQNQV